MRILVVDKDSRQLKAAKVQLRGHDLSTARFSDEAASLLRDRAKTDEPFERLATDIWIPRTPGEESLRPDGVELAGIAFRRGIRHIVLYSDYLLDGLNKRCLGIEVACCVGESAAVRLAITLHELSRPGGYYASHRPPGRCEPFVAKNWVGALELQSPPERKTTKE